ncbi:MAG: T9SS type A sorting domain-containing protein [bacterium]
MPVIQLSAFELTDSSAPKITVDSQGKPHVVWVHNTLTYPEIYYTTFSDTGWSTPLNISQTLTLASYSPDIVVDSQDHLHVVWAEGLYGGMDIVHREFDGVQWLPAEVAYQDPCNSYDPCLAIDGWDRLHVAYRDDGNFGSPFEIGYLMFDGISWSQPVNISQIPSQTSQTPDIAIDAQNHPHVIWQQLTSTGKDVFYAYYNGSVWSTAENITNQSADGITFPSIVISNQNVIYVLFSLGIRIGQTTYSHVTLTCQQDNSWTVPDTVFDDATSLSSCMALGSGNVLHCIVAPMVDPGNTEIYYTYTTTGTSSLQTTLTPQLPPIVIPAEGGNFAFDAQVANLQVLPLNFDLWTDCVLPNGHVSRYFLYRTGISVGVGSSILRTNLQQNIPGSAPAGDYFYRLLTGEYPSVVVAADSFAFSKEGSGVGDWGLEGWSLSETISGNPDVGVGQIFLSATCSPNPFNAATMLTFTLPQAGMVRLEVFNMNGRAVGAFHETPFQAGTHQITFDGSNLPSGIYFYQLRAGDFKASGKMILMK